MKNVFRIPFFVIADTENSLIKAMMANNVKYDREFEYFDIQKVGSKWFAWFYQDATERDAVKIEETKSNIQRQDNGRKSKR